MATARIVYASMTGNTEEIAEIIEEELENHGVSVTTTEVSQAIADDFADVDICIVATYTFSDSGSGMLPDEAVDFYEELKEVDLHGKVFAAPAVVITSTPTLRPASTTLPTSWLLTVP